MSADYLKQIEITAERAQSILAQLKATMSDRKLWPPPEPDEMDVEAAHQADTMAAWDALYKFTCQAWDETVIEGLDRPDISGIELCKAHPMFTCCLEWAP